MRKLIRINLAATLLLTGIFFGVNKLFATPLGECPKPDPGYTVYLAHASDASKYYVCIDGIPRPQDCTLIREHMFATNLRT